MNSTTLPPNKAATPLMQQYLRIKERYPEEVVFFRLGDFYEMFFEDALRASPILELILTQRQGIPMCGIPYHAATNYLSKMIKAGVSVAIAEQLEDPKKTKGMVKRDVVRVVTPGTLVEDELLPSKANNFLVAISLLPSPSKNGGRWRLVAVDVSTGQQWVGEGEDNKSWNGLKTQISSLSPSEILLVGEAAHALVGVVSGPAVIKSLPPLEAVPFDQQAQAAVRRYLARDHAEAARGLREPAPLPLAENGFMFLDETAIRNLELVQSTDPSRSTPTLLSVLDRTVTALGGRLLRWWLLHPLINMKVIQTRLEQVESLVEDSLARENLRKQLAGVADIERISVRAQAGTVSPRDLEGLRNSLIRVPEIVKLFGVVTPAYPINFRGNDVFYSLLNNLQIPAELVDILTTQLSDEPPVKLLDGGVIREGVSPELDELRRFRKSGRQWVAELETREREKTGITNLKIGFNEVFGYYLEVSRSHLSKVPAEWIRKQTMVNGERYITPALKEQEEKILGAEEKIHALEAALYAELVHQVAAFGPTLAVASEGIAHLDSIASLAEAAVEQGFTKPRVTMSRELDIKGGRHPVIEQQITRDKFIPNDLLMEETSRRILIITGPNMAGKSTYLRQSALIVILAQMGSFVPAVSATIGIVDKIFTRIGASDRLAQGQSTFMVEMQEVATLLANATSRSLLILDEVGRGTSTYDGVSIAWAVIEYLAKGMDVIASPSGLAMTNSPRTLFATHYFELTDLEGQLPGVSNAHATAKEWPGPDGRRQVVFLYQIIPGAAERSFGIHVAEMAGIPSECVDRARQILHRLESGEHKISVGEKNDDAAGQMDLFSEHPMVAELKSLKVEELTPLEALNALSKLKEKLKG